ncbi:MAG: sigma 54-interacting transcriptional regulator [Polyangiaceae bacterium]
MASKDADDGAPLPEVLPGLVGASPKMRVLARYVTRCAKLPVPVLLRGESGTGKEAVARALHTEGPRASGPFVAVSGALLGGDVGLSSLLGHVRGAFTGAAEPRRGALRRADGGTLFIDEVGTMSAATQARLLRVVEDGQCEPLGADHAHPVDVRLVTATCEPLEAQVKRGRFRFDLYQRISACVVVLPPVRDRGIRDLELIVRHLFRQAPLSGRWITDEALQLLSRQRWPGNVRELNNVLVHAAMLGESECIDASAVIDALAARGSVGGPHDGRLDAAAILRAARGNISAAARQAGLPRSTFRDRLAAAYSDGRVSAGGLNGAPASCVSTLACAD